MVIDKRLVLKARMEQSLIRDSSAKKAEDQYKERDKEVKISSKSDKQDWF